MNPLDVLYYVHDGQQTIGPIKGSAVKIMIENGSLTPQNHITRVGEDQWALISSFGPFARASAAPPPIAPVRMTNQRVFAGFWIRLGAYLIDTVFLYILSLVTGFVFGVLVGFVMSAAGQDRDTIVAVARVVGGISGIVLAVVYFSAFLASKWQATPGKRLVGIYVIQQDGRRIGWPLAIGRYFAEILSSLTLCIGFLMIAWTDEKKALHDIVCGTRVVYGKPVPDRAVVDAF